MPDSKKPAVLLHGSFAETGKGHGTNLAIIAGLLGMQADDERIKISSQIAEESGITIIFEKKILETFIPIRSNFI